jgi:hypothetical protein
MRYIAEKPGADNTSGWENCHAPLDPAIPELVWLSRRAKELHDAHGVILIEGAGSPGVHLTPKDFLDLFRVVERAEKSFISECSRYHTTVQGVEFSCLVPLAEAPSFESHLREVREGRE